MKGHVERERGMAEGREVFCLDRNVKRGREWVGMEGGWKEKKKVRERERDIV